MATIEVSRADDLGPALREVRLAERLSQSGLAQAAGVGRQWLNAFELGQKSSASLDMVMRVVAALDVRVVLVRPRPPQPGELEEPIDLDDLIDRLST